MKSKFQIELAIEEFKKRMETEREFCEDLYKYATVRALASKYAYYIESRPYLEDAGYDGLEQSWFIMGRALGYLKEDETSPCVGFSYDHPLANEAIELANALMKKPKRKV